MPTGERGGALRITLDDGLGERGVFTDGPVADRPAVRLGAEAQADRFADAVAQVDEVRIGGRLRDRAMERLVGSPRRLAIGVSSLVVGQRAEDVRDGCVIADARQRCAR